jgi:hypothetical protein
MYISALKAMEYLLDKTGEKHWKEWISRDISEWEKSEDVEHHLSAYGGMGSLNDIVLCVSNGHKLNENQEPWINPLFNWLKSLCFKLSQNPKEKFTVEDIKNKVGLYDSPLSAFVGGENVAQSMRGMFDSEHEIVGWHCNECSFVELTHMDIDSYLADTLLPSMMFDSYANGSLIELIDKVMAFDIPSLKDHRKYIADAIKKSGISLTEKRKGPMRFCPQCSSDHTGLYRWVLIDNRFRPLIKR